MNESTTTVGEISLVGGGGGGNVRDMSTSKTDTDGGLRCEVERETYGDDDEAGDVDVGGARAPPADATPQPRPRGVFRVGCNLQEGSMESSSDDTETKKWVDVTEYVNDCASRHLDVKNPMLCNPHVFSLHDSMAALELMDPAMDCCELPKPPQPPTPKKTSSKSTSGSGSRGDADERKAPTAGPPIVTDDDDDDCDLGGDADADAASKNHPTVVTVAPSVIVRHRPPACLDDPTCPPAIPWDDLTISDVRAIGCETLVRFRALLDGAGAAESTYTCLYAHDSVLDDMRVRLDPWIDGGGTGAGAGAGAGSLPLDGDPSRPPSDLLADLPPSPEGGRRMPTLASRLSLLALSLSLVKLSETARSIVQHGDIYEEEDFTINAYGFTFYPSADVAHVGAAVRAAMAALDGCGGNAEATATTGASDVRARDDVAMLRHILTFELNFLEACVALATLEPGAVETSVEHARTLLLEGEDHLRKLSKFLRTTVEEPMGDDDDDGGGGGDEKKKERERQRRVLEASFDSHVNRRLLGNTPVRKIRYRPIVDVVDSLLELSAELRYAVCDLVRLGDSYRRILTILNRRVSSSSAGGKCNVLTRSLVVLNLYFDDRLLGRHDLPTAVAATLNADGVPSDVTDSEYGGVFVHRLGKPLYDCLKMLTLNRSRQRSFVEAFVLTEWGDLQGEANTVDYHYRTVVAAAAAAADAGTDAASAATASTEAASASASREEAAASPPPPHVTNWVILHTVWIMEHHLTLSVELGLCHEPHDLAATYWYLSFLHSARLNVWTVMRTARKREEVRRRVLAAAAAATSTTTTVAGTDAGGEGKAAASDGNVNREQQHVPREGGGGGGSKSRKKKGRHHGSRKSSSSSSANANGSAAANARDRSSAANAANHRPHASAPSPPASSSAGERPRQLPAHPDVISPAEVEENIGYMLLGIRRSICSGIFQFIMALYQAEFLRPPPEYRFTSRRRQFEKRFEAFRAVPQPPHLSYDDLVKGSDFSGMARENLIASATESFKSAKALLDRVSTLLEQVSPAVYAPIERGEVTELTKVCVGNSLFLHKLSQMVKPGSDADARPEVVFDFNAHKEYCTIKIT